jgi:hypothetical protein
MRDIIGLSDLKACAEKLSKALQDRKACGVSGDEAREVLRAIMDEIAEREFSAKVAVLKKKGVAGRQGRKDAA